MMEERVLNRKFSSHLQNDCVQIFFLPVYFWLSNGYMTGEKLSFYIISVCLRLRFFLEINWEPYNEYEITCEKVHFPGARRQIALSSGGGESSMRMW